MKKIAALIFALALSARVLADSPVAAGFAGTHQDSQGYGVGKVVGSDWSGNTGSGMAVNFSGNALTATPSAVTKFAMVATSATAQYITITAATYILFSNPGGVDIVADWCATAATPTNLSNTGSVRIMAGQCLAQKVGNGIVPGYPWLVYSNMNYTTPYPEVGY